MRSAPGQHDSRSALKSGTLRIRRVRLFAQPRSMITACGTTRRPEAAQPRSVLSAVAAKSLRRFAQAVLRFRHEANCQSRQRLSHVSASNAF